MWSTRTAPMWEPRVPFRFDPRRPKARRALAVAVIVWRYVVDDEPVPEWLQTAWIQAGRAAAYEDRVTKSAYAAGSRGVGEIERVAVVVEACMRLAAAIVSSEKLGCVTDQLAS